MSSITQWARTSPGDDFWFWAIGLAVLAVAGFIAAFIFFYRKRLFEDTPTSRIRSAAQGYVELNGTGELLEGPPITAPLTGATCTWYRFRVEEHRGTGKNSRWVTLRKGTSDDLFLLRDDTGLCVIDPDGARVTPAGKNVWHGHSATPSQQPGGGTSGRRSIFTRFGRGFGRYRYTEERMHPGDPLYAIGLFRTEGGAGGNFDMNEDVRELLREWKQNADALLARFDQNRDGEICMQEWQTVREAAYQEVRQRHASEKIDMPTNLMGKTCDRRRPYILSALPESDLVKRYRLYYRAGLVAFFISGALATWLISLRLTG